MATITKDLKKRYTEDVVPALTKQFNYTNAHQVPKLVKIVLNMGLGEAVQNHKLLDSGVNDLTKIAGQKAVVTKAKKINIYLQSKNRYADWMYGYTPRSKNV